MREKFRVWDGGCMYMDCMVGSANPTINLGDGEWVECTENAKVMQSTGLEDKNGKEIYVGDVVENYAFRDVVIVDKGVVTTKNSARDVLGIMQPLAVHIELEVIGNIYINYDLLEDKS